jgi:CRISPR-associated endonuclease/helicase Cas3
VLSPADLSTFFVEVHGVEPFPWQRRLLECVVTRGWPARLDLPTASGKSAVIDVAVFALALSVGGERREPRRVFFVVDRRLVVDQVSVRARRLARALAEPAGPVSTTVAERLRQLGGELPLQVATLRGGMPLDHNWARDPAQPLVCVSTVDQVGSRLLFRGYGLPADATNQLPIHAGLVANDALIVLDEVHLAGAFARTLRAVARYRRWGEPSSSPWGVVEMSATHAGDGEGEPGFALSDADREHEVLGPRLRASKPTRLVEIEGDADDPQRHLARGLVDQALDLRARDPELRVIGIVANRVRTARLAFELLRDRSEAEAVLLVGPARPWDREALLKTWLPCLQPDRPRDDVPPVFVVATQCIEAGADLDLDALVTECASLGALRQRFGRLNRIGRRVCAPGVVLAWSRQLREAKDPVYGPALATTWRWLAARAPRAGRGRRREATVDLGVEAMQRLLSEATEGPERRALDVPVSEAPVLLPAHLDLLAQTSPPPEPDVEVGLFLHGADLGSAEVQVVWRGDLSRSATDSWAAMVALAPPTSREAIALPISAVRRWLLGDAPADVADVERAADPTLEASGLAPADARPCLRWQGPRHEGTTVVEPAGIRPGDTIVVPCDYGGADAYGWCPESHCPVADLAEAVSPRPLLRLHPDVLRWQVREGSDAALATLRELVQQLAQALAGDEPVEDLEQQALELLADENLALPWVRQQAALLLSRRQRRRSPYPDGRGVVLTLPRQPGPTLSPRVTVTDEDDETSLVGEVPLTRHHEGVAERVVRSAMACGLPRRLVEDLRLAARHHDLGKRDPAYQLFLHRGDRLRALLASEPLAKGATELRTLAAWREAWQRSGLARGYRHEAVSVAMLEDQELATAYDPGLVRHLIASHHGCARPFFPVPEGPSPADPVVRLDGGVAERFWALTRRYGWYGLAYLEAVLRLADHRQSEWEEGQ